MSVTLPVSIDVIISNDSPCPLWGASDLTGASEGRILSIPWKTCCRQNNTRPCVRCALGCPKKWKFCDSGQMLGEVIIKWFYFYHFWFRQLFERAKQKNKTKNKLCACADFLYGAQSIRNAAENYKKNCGFFGWVKIWKMM